MDVDDGGWTGSSGSDLSALTSDQLDATYATTSDLASGDPMIVVLQSGTNNGNTPSSVTINARGRTGSAPATEAEPYIEVHLYNGAALIASASAFVFVDGTTLANFSYSLSGAEITALVGVASWTDLRFRAAATFLDPSNSIRVMEYWLQVNA